MFRKLLVVLMLVCFVSFSGIVFGSDDESVQKQSGIERALEIKKITKDAKQKYDIWNSTSFEDFQLFLNRVDANTKLRDAILQSKEAGFTIFISTRRGLHISSNGDFWINPSEPDDEIIEFLIGK